MKHVILATILLLLLPVTVHGEPYETGIASWYGGEFHGKLTANGEVFDTYILSAAHQSLPFGTLVRVTNQHNGLHVEVRINDRGPFWEGRIIDLSYAAAQEIDMVRPGTAPVTLEILYLPAVPEDLYHRMVEAAYYYIQAAAFSSEERALESADKIEGSQVKKGKDGLFRLIIPDIPESSLEETRMKLEELGFQSVLIRAQE